MCRQHISTYGEASVLAGRIRVDNCGDKVIAQKLGGQRLQFQVGGSRIQQLRGGNLSRRRWSVFFFPVKNEINKMYRAR